MIWAATGRSGGASPAPFDTFNLAAHVGDDPIRVAAHRESLRTWIGADALITLSAVHGSDVVTVDEAMLTSGEDPVADGVVVTGTGVALMALGADCLTVAIAGEDETTVAAVHCGWRGLAGDVVGAALAAMEDRGTRAGQVILGPAICGTCYPVPRERIEELHDRCTAAVASTSTVTCPDGQQGIDVRRGVRARLEEWGISPAAVTSIDRCTAEDPGLFSHRRDGRTGRQGMVIMRGARMTP